MFFAKGHHKFLLLLRVICFSDFLILSKRYILSPKTQSFIFYVLQNNAEEIVNLQNLRYLQRKCKCSRFARSCRGNAKQIAKNVNLANSKENPQNLADICWQNRYVFFISSYLQIIYLVRRASLQNNFTSNLLEKKFFLQRNDHFEVFLRTKVLMQK